MILIQDDVMVELCHEGEGYNGDYDDADLEDVALLRFYVSVLEDGGWENVDDSSYCTLLPAEGDEEDTKLALGRLMGEFYDVLHNDHQASVKRLAERLSWIGQ